MRGSDWSKVLRLLYEKESSYALPLDGNGDVMTSNYGDLSIAEELDLTLDEIADSADFLHKRDMIYMDNRDYPSMNAPGQNEISLTRLGFEVALDQSQTDERRHLDTLIGVFTLILAAGTLTQALVALVQLDNLETSLIISVSVSVIMVLGALALFKFLGLHPIQEVREWVQAKK